jgi:hypothetical protein
MDQQTINTIIGYVLFGISELLTMLPTPSNSILQIIIRGLKTIKPSSLDLETQNVSNAIQDSEIKNIVNKISINPDLKHIINVCLNNPQIVPQIETLLKLPQLDYIITLLKNNPQIIPDVKVLIENGLRNGQLIYPQNEITNNDLQLPEHTTEITIEP